MEEEEIDVVNYEAETSKATKTPTEPPLKCEDCEYIGRTERGLNAHRRHKHQKPEVVPKLPRTPAKSRKIQIEEEPRRVTTKQLLGGRKRPKTVIDHVEEVGINRNPPIRGLEMIDQNMPVREFVTRRTAGEFADIVPIVNPVIDDMGGSMVVGEEVEIDGEVEEINPDDLPVEIKPPVKKYVPRSREAENAFDPKPYVKTTALTQRLTQGDSSGKYKCYVAHCEWRGNYRSLRMEHMKALHPDWKMPPRYLLQRISKDGVYIDPADYVPPIACTVEGCEWRGNFRASRSAHMRKVHPAEHAESKKKLPGYNSNGSYTCHYPGCMWRGYSRSTRSGHIKKEHPEWRPDDTRLAQHLTCFHCKSSIPSYPHLVAHIEQHGGVGLHVEQDFESKEEFTAWLERIEGIYSIVFEKSESIAQSEEFSMYTLHCNCAAGRGFQMSAASRQYIYNRYNFLKRRSQQFLTRCKTDCVAHLEVREESFNERIIVKGTLEHCGHRFGTPLLRMSAMDRQLYSDVLEWKSNRTFRLSAMDAVEKLNTYEGFTMDNFSPPKTLELIEPLDETPIVSIRLLVEQSDQSSFFGVDFEDFSQLNERMSLGYMSEEMRQFWAKFGPDRVVTIDVSVADFETLELFQYSAIVTDDGFVPKCVLLYITTDQDTAYQVILEQLRAVDPRPPREFLCDASQIWVDTIEKVYPESGTTVLISEWSLMDYWAAKTEQLIDNEFDVFSIVTALRRLLRCEDVTQFMYFVVEFFEALFECGYDRFADFLDAQLSDVEYFKRWSPVHRNSFTSHAHPTLAVASRTLRDLYLSTEGIDRVDKWWDHAVRRVEEFNQVQTTQTFTLRPLDGPNKYYYQTMDIPEFHKQVVEQDAETVLVYEEEVEDFVEGDVVEEEVIGQMVYEEVIVKPEPPVVEEEFRRPSGLEQKKEEEDGGMTAENRINVALSPIPSPVASPPPPPPPSQVPRRPPPIPQHPSKRDTTKTVVRGVRGARKKPRFAELRDCPPEVMRAIAAHAIAYDGRKKEQQPFMYLPSAAQLAQTSTPVVPTPEYILNMTHRPLIAPRKQPKSVKRILPKKPDSAQQSSSSNLSHPFPHHLNMHRVHHEEVMEEDVGEEIHQMHDDNQPCTSASLYR